MTQIDELRQLIKEEMRKKNNILLEEPEFTNAGSPNRSIKQKQKQQTGDLTGSEDTETANKEPNPFDSEEEKNTGEKYTAGFNLYRSILAQSIVEIRNMRGETGNLIKILAKKLSQETSNNTSSQDTTNLMAMIQKSMLFALQHVDQVARSEALEKNIIKQ